MKHVDKLCVLQLQCHLLRKLQHSALLCCVSGVTLLKIATGERVFFEQPGSQPLSQGERFELELLSVLKLHKFWVSVHMASDAAELSMQACPMHFPHYSTTHG